MTPEAKRNQSGSPHIHMPRKVNKKEAGNTKSLGGNGGDFVVSESVQKLIEDIDVKAAVSVMKEGTFLLKYCNNAFRKPHQRLFWVDMESLTLKWLSPKKSAYRTQIFLIDVDRIVPGVDSDFWRNKREPEKKHGIELLLCSGRKLRLMCSQLNEWKSWLKGLLHAHQKAVAKRRRPESYSNDFITKQWLLADLDKNGSMSFNELIHLLQRLNCRADVRYALQLFEQFDQDGSCVLEFDEFKLLFHTLLTHSDLLVYFEKYKDNRLYTVTEESFRRFLTEVQLTPVHLIVEEAAQMHNLEEPFGSLTDLGFNLLLTSEFNSFINPEKKILNIQDMDQPLHAYWISTSHNTYLTGYFINIIFLGDQMIGKAAVGQYIDVLLRGCRCVELDCWDGSDGEPVIYHGHTLTGKISFEAVIRACRDYGFQKTSYPLILSLEMHCSPKQKRRVGMILKQELAGAPVPSPQELQGHFILKGRVPNEFGVEIEQGNEKDFLIQQEELELELISEFPDSYMSDCPRKHLSSLTGRYLVLEKSEEDIEENSSKRSNTIENNKAFTKRKALTLNDDLKVYYDSISLRGRNLTSLKNDKRGNMDICSLNEKRLSKMAKLKPKELATFHQQFLSRVFPSGTRLMSSNFNPMPFWSAGCQMVALNFQALGLATLLNLGRFIQNGSVGYVLKPNILRNPKEPFDPYNVNIDTLRRMQEAPIHLKIKILAAQQLPRPSYTEDKTNRNRDTACPYVITSIHGIPADTCSYRTNYVLNNGLNPRWTNQEYNFEITVPSLAIIVFEARHFDPVRSDFLAGAAAPVSAIRQGIRWVELYDSKLRVIHWCGLLIHVTIKPISRNSSLMQPETTRANVTRDINKDNPDKIEQSEPLPTNNRSSYLRRSIIKV